MKITRKLAAEAAVLCGVLGFFIGGLLGFKKEVVEMLLYATATGTAVFFIVILILLSAAAEKRGGSAAEKPGERPHGQPKKTGVGKRVDYTLEDSENFDDIFNIGKE